MNEMLARQIFDRNKMVRFSSKLNIKGHAVDKIIRDHNDILEKLISDQYIPAKLRTVSIPKDDGSFRSIEINSDLDRIICACINEYLSDQADSSFCDYNYGFRVKRGCIDAVLKVEEFINAGYPWSVKADIAKCFDNVDQDMARFMVSKWVDDAGLRKIIHRFMNVPVRGSSTKRTKGLQQGNNLSPLLMNMVLSRFDKTLYSRGIKFVRYADDICILKSSERAAMRARDSIEALLCKEFKLGINNDKLALGHINSGLHLFGFLMKGVPVSIEVSRSSILKFYDHIKSMLSEPSVSSKRLNAYIKGWFGYFKLGISPALAYSLDSTVKVLILEACTDNRTYIRMDGVVSIATLLNNGTIYSGNKKICSYGSKEHTL